MATLKESKPISDRMNSGDVRLETPSTTLPNFANAAVTFPSCVGDRHENTSPVLTSEYTIAFANLFAVGKLGTASPIPAHAKVTEAVLTLFRIPSIMNVTCLRSRGGVTVRVTKEAPGY